jgi:hypothetical protein
MKNEKFTHEEIIAIMTVKKALQKGEVEQQTALAAVKTLVIGALKREGIALNKNAEAQFDNVVKTEMAQGADLKTAITKALVTLKTNTNR